MNKPRIEGKGSDHYPDLLLAISKGIQQDREFNIHQLSRLMYMSRYTLHRYCVQTTGLSPGRLIRSVRLKKASQLLSQKKWTISDIAFDVGFNSSSYFSTEFKKHHGVCPDKWVSDASLAS